MIFNLRGVFGHLQEPLAWAESDESILDSIAGLVGAQRAEVALMNSLTVNLHILLVSDSFNKTKKKLGEIKALRSF